MWEQYNNLREFESRGWRPKRDKEGVMARRREAGAEENWRIADTFVTPVEDERKAWLSAPTNWVFVGMGARATELKRIAERNAFLAPKFMIASWWGVQQGATNTLTIRFHGRMKNKKQVKCVEYTKTHNNKKKQKQQRLNTTSWARKKHCIFGDQPKVKTPFNSYREHPSNTLQSLPRIREHGFS